MNSSRKVNSDLKAHSGQTMPSGRKMHALSNKTAGFLGIRRISPFSVPRQSVRRHNVGTKHLAGHNIWKDETSGRQNVRGDKTSGDRTSVGQNVCGKKISVGTKHPWGQNVREHNVCLGNIFNVFSGQYSLKNLLSVKEKSARTTLSVPAGGWGNPRNIHTTDNSLPSTVACPIAGLSYLDDRHILMQHCFLQVCRVIDLEAILSKYCYLSF
jgi:hypothetical protein